MPEIHDVTEALSQILSTSGHARSDVVESVRYATIRLEDVPALIEDPKTLVKKLGVPVQEHSHWSVALTKRSTAVAAAAIIVIIVHFGDCSGVIIIRAIQ
jgi:hypothetical protein